MGPNPTLTHTFNFSLCNLANKILLSNSEIKQICSADLHGYLVFIPCNVLPLIEIEYGKNFMDPNPKIKYAIDAHNWRINGTWTKKQWKGGEVYKVYQ